MPGRKNDSETVEQRRERILLLHVAGKSAREIAESEEISLSQVYRDLQESTGDLQNGLLARDKHASTRMVLICQEITARAMNEGRYGAALRAIELEARLRSDAPPVPDPSVDIGEMFKDLPERLRALGLPLR